MTADSRVSTVLLTAVLLSACAHEVVERTPRASGSSSARLRGKTIAILATDGFEQVELEKPRAALEAEGAVTVVVAPVTGSIQGFNQDRPGDKVKVDLPVSEATVVQFDGLLLPGGVANPDALRTDDRAVSLVRAFATAGKPIAAICHGPWTLVEADVLRGRTLTSWPSLKSDVTNAGAHWVDQPVVVDANLVTSRKPEDIPEFVEQAIQLFAKGASQPMEVPPTEHTDASQFVPWPGDASTGVE